MTLIRLRSSREAAHRLTASRSTQRICLLLEAPGVFGEERERHMHLRRLASRGPLLLACPLHFLVLLPHVSAAPVVKICLGGQSDGTQQLQSTIRTHAVHLDLHPIPMGTTWVAQRLW